jgi:hypothetical protein
MNALHLKDGLYPFDGVLSSVERGNRQSAKWPIDRFSILFQNGAMEMQMSRTISTGVLMADTSVSLGFLPVHHNNFRLSNRNLSDMDEMVMLRRLRERSKIIYEPPS